MDIDEHLKQQLLAIFEIEVVEQLQVITQGLLELEKVEPDQLPAMILEDIFRAAHSLKGAARGVGQPDIVDITHRLESIFNALKKGRLHKTVELFNVALSAVDRITDIVTANKAQKPYPFNLDEFLAALDACLLQEAPKLPEPPVQQEPALLSATILPVSPSVTAATSEPFPAAKHRVIKNDHKAAGYTIAATDINHLAVIAEEFHQTKILLKQHLKDFQQFSFGLESITRRLNENVAAMPVAMTASLSNPVMELSLLTHAVFSTFHDVRDIHAQLNYLSQAMDEAINSMRLVKFAVLLAPLQRIVRDLAQKQNKQINFIISGDDIKIDRNLYKFLHDPLIHLINNAIDHGIETLEERIRQGKPEQATLLLKINKAGGNNIRIILSDDGKGIDIARIKSKAIYLHLLSPNEADKLTDQQLTDFIFKAGFSSVDIITDTSGRGVGLDVVRTNLRKIKGNISVSSEIKQGTTFTLIVPVTLSSERGILVIAAGQKFAIQSHSVMRVVDVVSDQLIALNEQRVLLTETAEPLALYTLASFLKLPVKNEASAILPTVIIADEQQNLALVVDEIIGDEDIIIKPYRYPLLHVPFSLGIATLGSGELVPVLDSNDLINAVNSVSTLQIATLAPQPQAVKRILVVDDSITSRTLEKNILEKQGYQVKDMVDGVQAWQELSRNPGYDLIIADVEMPFMNGFELIEKIKKNEETRHIPAIIVSSLNSEEDKKRGVQVGADAYITKDLFDSGLLLKIIKQLL